MENTKENNTDDILYFFLDIFSDKFILFQVLMSNQKYIVIVVNFFDSLSVKFEYDKYVGGVKYQIGAFYISKNLAAFKLLANILLKLIGVHFTSLEIFESGIVLHIS